jgi:oligoendopeptidase F
MFDRSLYLLFLVVLFCLGGQRLASASGKASNTVPKRSEVNNEYKWKLEDIYTNNADWEKDFTYVKSMLPKLAQYQGRMANSPKTLLECLSTRDQVGQIFGKLYVYARMHQDEDTVNTTYQALADRAAGLASEVSTATAYINPELLAIPTPQLESYRREEPGLALYNQYFDELLRLKNHILSPAEEAILAQASEVLRSPETIRSMLNNADMKFPKIQDEEGQEIELSEGRYYKLITSPDRRVRKDAFAHLLGTYKHFENTYGAALNNNVKKNVFYARVKKYDSALQAALQPDNIPVDVYTNVVKTINANLAPLHRYMRLKKKALSYQELHMYDLYAPLTPAKEKPIEYNEALTIVEEGLKPLGSEYHQILTQGFTSGWIDVYENQGKRKGAYAWGSYGTHPYVLLNYNNTLRDVMTLAHEMGHAIHTYYSHANQPYQYSDYTIFCAEVASTTNEALLIRHLLNTTNDKQQKLFLLDQYLEQFRGTVYRQTLFAEFEKSIHEKVESGEALTPDLLSTMWHTLNEKYYGPDVVVDPEIDMEWARISHFYWNFYVYKYVTGYAAGTAFANKILTEGDEARNKYVGFLKSGSSDYSLNILKKAGVDLATPEPLESAIKVFEEMLGELEKLVNE